MTARSKAREIQSPKPEFSRSQIAAAKLIVKRDKEGKGKVAITPDILRAASFDL
ncbi:RNA helicase [Corynebacterium genitalium]|nr:RNA helicase [Corynebacterium genitalium]